MRFEKKDVRLTQQRTIITCGARFDVKDRTLKDWEFKELAGQ